MSRLKVLLTNENFDARGGASLYVRDVALELQRRGHKPVIFSPELGELTAEVRRATIPVISRLDDLAEPPDVIHGQHELTTMKALLHFPQTPAVYVCHSWEDAPVAFPRVLRYVAVDETCYDHLVSENGIAPGRVKLLLNFADITRFKPRGPLPPQPEKAVIFSNGVAPGLGLEAIREACARAGISVSSIGYGTSSVSANPEALLPEYDIVFAKARCAIEALAVGCAVVVCDIGGLADMVTTENFEELRRLNFGRRSLVNPLDPALIFNAIRRYSSHDAARVTKDIRNDARLDTAVRNLVSLYEDVIREHKRLRPDVNAELRATEAFLDKVGRSALSEAQAQVTSTPSPGLPALTNEPLLTPLLDVPLEELKLAAGKTLVSAARADDEGVMLKTEPLPWQYAALLPLAAAQWAVDKSRAAVVRVRLRLHSGSVGVGVLNEERTEFVARQQLQPTAEAVDVTLPVHRLDAVSDLVFQNWDQPIAGLIEIKRVEVLLAGIVVDGELAPVLDAPAPAHSPRAQPAKRPLTR